MLFGVYDEEIEKQVIREEAIEEERARADLRVQKERAKAIIDTLLDVGYQNEEIIATLQKKLGIKEQQAGNYLEDFYNKTL